MVSPEKRILVTGAGGYIGSMLCKHFTRRSWMVRGVDLKWGEDYRDKDAEWLRPWDWIVHLAAHSSVPACKADPSGAYANNVTGLIDMLGALQPSTRVIYASSGSVYDGLPGVPDETADLNPPRNPYDETKQAADLIIGIHFPKAIGLRFGTVCGVSGRMRHELIMADMAREVVETGSVTVRNTDISRPILGLNDLCRWAESAIDQDIEGGFYNLASETARAEDIAIQVAAAGGGMIAHGFPGPAYDFRMNVQKARRVCQTRETIASIALDLVRYYRAMKEDVTCGP